MAGNKNAGQIRKLKNRE